MAATRVEAHPGQRKVVIRFLDALLRDTVASWVDSLPGYQVAGAVSGGPALVELCTEHPPDVAVVQLGSAAADELSMISELCGVRPIPHVVGLHPALDPTSLLRLHRAGANRLVSSRAGLPALRAALGDTEAERRGPSRPAGLSERELEVLTLLSAGCPVAKIADALEISPHTVTNHKRHIFTKLGVHSRAQAAAEAGRLGLEGRARYGTAERVVVVGGGHDSRAIIADLLGRGASAVLGAADAAELLPAANALVTAGYLVAPEEAVRGLLTGGVVPNELTCRERDILASVALGHSVRQTAQTLGIAVKTVQSVQRQLFSKLGARNRLDALARARELNLVTP